MEDSKLTSLSSTLKSVLPSPEPQLLVPTSSSSAIKTSSPHAGPTHVKQRKPGKMT